MSRQRRMDAIARRRAFIDSQLQLLSSNETRVPNIIRSRAGATKPKPRYQYKASSIYQTVVKEEGLSSIMYAGSSSSSSDNPATRMSYHQEAVGATSSVISDADEGSEEMFLTVMNTDTGPESVSSVENNAGEEGGVEDAVPIAISNADIAKMFSSNEELMKGLQTIQTDDGTVMVVLEGGDFGEEKQLANDGGGDDDEAAGPLECQSADTASNSNNVRLSEFVDNTVTLPSSSYPEENDQVPETQQTIVMDEESGESYVVFETSEGTVLIPSSMCSQSQETGTPPRSEEGIVDFVASEGAAIEKLIRKKSTSTKTVKKRKTQPTASTYRLCKTPQSSSLSLAATSPSASFNGKAKCTVSSTSSLMFPSPRSTERLNVQRPLGSAGSSATTAFDHEKPRPFRFELPELDSSMNDLDDNFMSVPVPIAIENIRSKPGKKKLEEEGCESFTYRVPVPKPEVGIDSSKTTHEVHHYSDAADEEEQLERQENDSSKFKCNTCSEIFSKDSDLHLHSQQSHLEGHSVNVSNENIPTVMISSASTPCVPTNESVATSSHSESQINELILDDSIYSIKCNNNNEEEIYIQIGRDEPTLKKIRIDETGDGSFAVVDETETVGRRTLNKASAKANMCSEVSQVGSWESQSEKGGIFLFNNTSKKVVVGIGDDDEPITIQSARIRSRNDRTIALDNNVTNEEEISDNFQKIFMQVCSETRC